LESGIGAAGQKDRIMGVPGRQRSLTSSAVWIEEEFIFFAQKPNIKMNKHVNKVRKATGRGEAITAGR